MQNRNRALMPQLDSNTIDIFNGIIAELKRDRQQYVNLCKQHSVLINTLNMWGCQGHKEAQYMMARLTYYYPPSIAAFSQWMTMAAQSMHPYAIYNLAIYFVEGSGLFKKNTTEALRLFDLLLQGEDFAVIELAEKYLQNKPLLKQQLTEYQHVNQKEIVRIKSISDYFRLTNHENLTCQNNKNLDNLKDTIYQFLSHKESPLFKSLIRLTENQKIKFITALITNNKAVIQSTLVKLLGNYPGLIETYKKELGKIAEHKTKNFFKDGVWLSGTVHSLIITMTLTESMLPFSLRDQERLFSAVMQSIPDDLLDLQSKRIILGEIDKNLLRSQLNIEYVESPKPLTKNLYKGNIYKKELEFALKSKKLDSSEFVFLLSGFLQTFKELEMIKQQLTEVHRLYVRMHYGDAINKLFELCKSYEAYIGNDLYETISIAHSAIKTTDLNLNHSRRFFETRLAQLYQGMLLDHDGISKISQRFISRNLSSNLEIEKIMLLISNYTSPRNDAMGMDLKSKSANYMQKSSSRKPGMLARLEESKGLLSESIYSRNSGLLKSISPNFYDEITEVNLRNRIVDARSPDQYALSKEHIVTAGSLSGHTFHLVCLLHEYMQENKSDATLNADINNFIKAFIVTYINRGFHSLIEITDVLAEEQVKNIFRQYNVTLDLFFSDNDSLLEQAFKDTQEYTKNLCLKKSLHDDLLSRKPLKNTIMPVTKRPGFYLTKPADNKTEASNDKTMNDTLGRVKKRKNTM